MVERLAGKREKTKTQLLEKAASAKQKLIDSQS
jgi:hypothetical protein